MVYGSIGYGKIDELKKFYNILKNNGFDVLDHLSKIGMDYSDIKDFRDKRNFASKIVDLILILLKKQMQLWY